MGPSGFRGFIEDTGRDRGKYSRAEYPNGIGEPGRSSCCAELRRAVQSPQGLTHSPARPRVVS